MTEIKNYKFREFLGLDADLIAEYMIVLRNLKPLETKVDVMELTLLEVDELKKTFLEPTDQELQSMIAMVQEMEPKEVMEMPILKFFPLYNSIVEQLERICKAEQQLESKYPDPKWEMVEGSSRMAKFGLFNTTIALAQQFHTIPQEIEKWKYSYVFSILLYNVTTSDLHLEMTKIKTPKQ